MSHLQSRYHNSPKRPIYHITNTPTLLKACKYGSRILSSFSFHYDSSSSSETSETFKKANKFLKRAKYIRTISYSRRPMASLALINSSIKAISKFNNVKHLRLTGHNSKLEDRITHYQTLKPLRKLNRLQSLQFNVYFHPIRRSIYSQFGKLVKALRVKQITIREPFTAVSDRHLRRFYTHNRRTAKYLKSLAFTYFRPFEGSIEGHVLSRFLRKSINLQELYLNLIGVMIENHSFKELVVLIKSLKNLKKLNLDLSFNKVTNMEGLEILNKNEKLQHVHFNFSYCPLSEEGISKLTDFIQENPKLTTLTLLLNSTKITQEQISKLTEAINSLNNLQNISLCFAEAHCIDLRTLNKILKASLTSHNLTKAHFNFSQALRTGLPPMFYNTEETGLRLPSLKYLELDLSNNSQRDSETTSLLEYLKQWTLNIRELKLKLDSYRLNQKTEESLCKWINLLRNLKYLEISFKDIHVNTLFVEQLLKVLERTGLHELNLEFSDTMAGRELAEFARKNLSSRMKALRTVKILPKLASLSEA